ncbi:MAG: NHL repeat-containing protein [Limisphaerales bacterium]
MSGFSGANDGVGSAARFNSPYGVAVDNGGNVYVAEEMNDTIRKITPGGAVTTLAGSAGQIGSADGKGSGARFQNPRGVAVDTAANVYVADTFNHTIRKIRPDGVVTTLAGTAGQIGSTDGTGSAARFNNPYGVALDRAGNVYVADFGNHTIRKITPDGVVTTLAGTAGQIGSTDGTGSAARFFNPSGVAVDSAGSVYVVDAENYTIRKITLTGIVTTLAGSAGPPGSRDGTASAARLGFPMGVAVDSAGTVYVASSSGYSMIRKITPAGVVTTLAGRAAQQGSADGIGSVARFNNPNGVAVDGEGNIYVGDSGNNRITKGTPSAGVTSRTGPKSLSETRINAQAEIDRAVPFDSDVGFDTTWAAEKKLIGFFRAEGFIMRGQPYKGGVEHCVFERASDGANVNYAYVRPVSGALAEYRLSASRNSPGLTVLLSVAGKISADRLSVIKEALDEFSTTKQRVVKQHGGFKERGDFRVKTDENTLELDNLWKAKGM